MYVFPFIHQRVHKPTITCTYSLSYTPTPNIHQTHTKPTPNSTCTYSPSYTTTHTGQGSITCSGTVAATLVESPIDAVEGLMGSDMPLAYYFGHATPSDNPELYR